MSENLKVAENLRVAEKDGMQGEGRDAGEKDGMQGGYTGRVYTGLCTPVLYTLPVHYPGCTSRPSPHGLYVTAVSGHQSLLSNRALGSNLRAESG